MASPSNQNEITSELNFPPNEGLGDQVSAKISGKLALLPSSRSNYSTCIFRVDDQLRKGNEKAYEPEVIAIGPYHHGRANLQVMEEHKLHYFRSLLDRNGNNPDKYVAAMRSLVGNMRSFYADPIGLDEDELVEMMVLDSCFVIELIQKFAMPELREDGDRIFKIGRVLLSVQRDLMLFENQLPLFVLWRMFVKIEEISQNHKSLFSLILNFFGGLVPRISKQLQEAYEEGRHLYEIFETKHMLASIHGTFVPNVASIDIGMNRNESNDNISWDFIPSATELTDYCVQFEKNMNIYGESVFDIEFLNGIMKLPPLSIEDGTETLFRNLVAYEQYVEDEYTDSRAVTQYVKFLGRLIDSPKDVAILRERQIISTSIRDDEVISNIFKNIAYSVTEPVNLLPFYSKICKDVHTHCKSRIVTNWKRHTKRWMVMLWGSYLNSPWRVISILAATILLVLTFMQTLFTVHPRQ